MNKLRAVAIDVIVFTTAATCAAKFVNDVKRGKFNFRSK